MEVSLADERFMSGDHLEVQRVGYSHHGIYLGNGRVAEFGGDKAAKTEAAVRAVDLAEFDPHGLAHGVSHDKPPLLAQWMPTSLPREERVARTLFLVETAATGRYNLFGHNCEHAATWCATGFPESHQVRVGLYLNMIRSATTASLASYAYRKAGRIPRWIIAATLIGFWAVTEYHVHQGRFVREIDRAWRARQSRQPDID
jgi:HRAS-like suppressor 3